MKFPQNEWGYLLEPEKSKPYFKDLIAKVNEEYQTHTVFPKKENIFRALELTDYRAVKVLILGQDPYHGENQSHGLAFSVPIGEPLPPSLRNIMKELEADLHIPQPENGYLEKWAKQGVLLLNAILTVRKGEPLSHASLGWEQFTDQIVHLLNLRKEPVIFVLWGKSAQKKKKWIANQHIIVESVHPSPLSAYRGFFGSRPFSTINRHLLDLGQTPIDWSLT